MYWFHIAKLYSYRPIFDTTPSTEFKLYPWACPSEKKDQCWPSVHAAGYCYYYYNCSRESSLQTASAFIDSCFWSCRLVFLPSGQPPWLVWFGGYSAILVLLHKTKSLLLLLCWGKAVDIGRGRDRSGRMTRSLCVMHKINAFGLTLAGRLGLNEFL